MKRLAAFIWALIVLSAVSRAALADAPPGGVARDASFPRNATVGQSAYGYTYYNDAGGGLDKRTYHGWCRPLAEGDTAYWRDRNSNGAVETDERESMHWWAWYNAEVEVRFCPAPIQGPDGRLRMSAKAQLETRAKAWNLTQSLPLGDGAFIGGDPFCHLAVAYGPFLITVTVHGYLLPFTDINGVEPARFPSAYLDGPALLEKGRAWRAGRRNEAIRLANDVIANLQPWLAHRIGSGPDFRGLCATDARPYVLGPADVAKGFVARGTPPDTSRPVWNGFSQDFVRRVPGSTRELESFSVATSIRFYSGNENEASGEVPVDEARKIYENEARGLYKPTKAALQGADESVRSVRRDGNRTIEVVAFRCANVFVIVRGFNETGGATTQAMPVARKILARLRGGADQTPIAPTPPEPTETPAAGEADLVVHPYDIHLTPLPHWTDFPRERAADRQNVRVLVANMGKAPAKDVFVQLYTAAKGASPTPVGAPIAVGAIDPSRNKTIDAVWDLKGSNVEATTLLVKAYTKSGKDANPKDNLASITCHIWYASNGKRAFSAFDDTYRFVNFGWNDREFEEMLEGILATVINAMDTRGDERKALGRLVFPVAFGRLKTYLQESMRAGSGGHCYGMSATAGLYFEDPALKPVPVAVPSMTLAQASTNINIYQRAQMLPVLEAIAHDRQYQVRDRTPKVCFDWVRNALNASRLAPVLEFFGVTGQGANLQYLGHAVLAYKLVHVEGRDPVVYVYDPNFPVSALPTGAPLPYITLRIDKGTWSNPSYMGYDWADANQISAHRVFRQMPLDGVNALVPSLKRLGYAMADTLYRTKKMMTMVRCPVDAVVTDSKGRRTGIIDGKAVNEIPKARLVADAEVKIFVLPADETYTVSLTGTGKGTMALDVMRADTPEQARVTSFEQVPVTKGGTFTGRLQPSATSLSGAGGAVAPAFDTTVAIPAAPAKGAR